MTKLDEIALNIELVLISIIEAVALTFLAENAIEVMHSPEWLLYIPYLAAGLTIILVFWSQAILHAVSFIRWPLRMEHMLLYFVAAFLQVIAYSELTDVRLWFLCWIIFSIVAYAIYIADLRIIREVRARFVELGAARYIDEVERRHIIEMKYLVPIAVAFNVFAAGAAYFVPEIEAQPLLFVALGTLQFLITLGALVDCVRNLKARAELLPSLF